MRFKVEDMMKQHVKPKNGGHSRVSALMQSLGKAARQAVSGLSCVLVAVQPVLAQNVIPTAGGPQIVAAPNGVDMVMIQTPNAQGVSHNTYQQFNVGPTGLILNNVDGNFAQTQLAGLVQGNTNLQGGAASIILNEVVGGTPSSLTGYLEVAGARADVIVANPYGMTCNGCGFLNTDRLTLTTGTPQFNGGQFTGVSVDDGTIGIGANGLDALDTTRFDLISRQITVAGSVQGQRIRVIAGRNDVIYATGDVTARADNGSAKPSFAIDSTVLGGMYAGAISITSTEQGVGVRAPSQMAASTGEMTLTADGRLIIGRASAAGSVQVTTTQGSVEIDDSLSSGSTIRITSAEDLVVQADARIVSQAASVFDAARDITVARNGELAAGGSISADAGRDIAFGQTARVLSYGDISLNGTQIDAASGAQVMAGAANQAGMTTAATLTMTATTGITLRDATVASGGAIDVTTRVLNIAAAGGLPAARFVATTDARFALTRLEALDGAIQAGQMLQIENAGGILTVNGGVLQAGDALLLSGQGVDFDATAQSLNGAVVAHATSGDMFIRGILAGQAADILASGLLDVSGTIQAAGQVSLIAGTLGNSGTLRANDLRLEAATITNTGQAYGAAALTLIASGSINNSSTLVSDGWLRIANGSSGTAGQGPVLNNLASGEIIAAGDAVLTVSELNNAGVIASTQGRLLVTSVGDVTNAQTGVLYGQTLLQILSDRAITNDGGALLAQTDLIVGGITGAQASRFTNRNGGLVETFAGDIQIAAAVFENLRPAPVVTSTTNVQTNRVRSGNCSGTRQNCLTTTTTETVVTQNATIAGLPAQIISGADMRLSGGAGVNAYSLISASGDMVLSFATLTNLGLDLIETSDVVRDYHRAYKRNILSSTRHTYWTQIDPPVVTSAGAIFGTIEAGGSITGIVTGYLQNGAVQGGVIPTTSGAGVPGFSGTTPGTVVLNPLGSNLSGISASGVGNAALIVTNVNPNASFLVETRYQFIDLSQFLSSNYFLSELGYDPDAYAKRLGDAYVETQFLRAQLFELTGQRLMQPGVDERAQMQALYDNAIDAAAELNLAVGVALTPEQIEALTNDIIWLEEVVVDGQTVLAPRLYLASASSLARTGAAQGSQASRISAGDLTLIAGAFTNAGSISASDNLRLTSLSDMDILGGSIAAGGLVQLDVTGTLTSLSGTIQGTDVQIAAGNIVLATARVTAGEGENMTQGAARTSTITASGDLTLQAIEDITLTGAQLQAGGDTTLAAGGGITLAALDLKSQTSQTYDGGYSRSQGVINLVSGIATGGDLTLYAAGQTGTGRNITLQGAQLQAGAGMIVQADRGDVLLNAVANTFYSDVTGSSSGFLSKSSSRDQVFSVSHQVTSLTAGSIDVLASGSIRAEGTEFTTDGATQTGAAAVSNGNLALTAATGSLVFTAPTDIYAESRVSENSFLGGLGGSSSDIRTLDTQSLGSVANIAGDIDLSTGADLVLTAVDWTATGDIRTQVAGETLLLAAVDTSYRAVETMNNNMILITTVSSEDYTETATFNSLNASGVVDLDPTSDVTLDAVRNPLIGSSHAAGLLGDSGAGMALAATYLGLTDPSTGPPDGIGGALVANPDPTSNTASTPTSSDWREDLNLITAALPTGADGNGYLYLDGLVERDGTVINAVMLVDEHFYEETTALNPAFQALLTIVITPGIGGLELFSGLGEVGAAAANKALVSGITQSIAGVVSGDFDLGEILKGAALSGISSYASAEITNSLLGGLQQFDGAGNLIKDQMGNPVLTTGSLSGFISDLPSNSLLGIGDNFSIQNIISGGIESVVSTGVNSAIYGTDFGAGLLDAIVANTVSLAMADVQNGIGDIFQNGANGGEGSLGHVTLHAIAGCMAAEAQGADCAAGAAGGLAQAVYAGSLDGTTLSDEQQRNRAELIGGLAGFFTSSGEAANVSAAASIALSGMANNRLLHRTEAELILRKAEDFAELMGISIEEATTLLIAEALRGVSRDFTYLDENEDARAFLDSLSQGYVGDIDGQTLFGELARTGDQYRNSTINLDVLYDYKSLYDSLNFYTTNTLEVGSTIAYAGALHAHGKYLNRLSREQILELFNHATAANDSWAQVGYDVLFSNADDEERGLLQALAHINTEKLITGFQRAAVTSNHFTFWERYGGTDPELTAIYTANIEALLIATGGIEGALALGIARSVGVRGLATNNVRNGLPDNPSQIRHIFGDRAGHLPDTPANRQLLLDTSNNSANNLGSNRFGNQVHASTRPDGSQVWVETRNGVIQNGGSNNPPWIWVAGEGLRRP